MEIIDRLKAKTPKFFRWIIGAGISLGTMGASLLIIDGISPKLKDMADNFILTGVVATFVSSLAKQDKPQEDEAV